MVRRSSVLADLFSRTRILLLVLMIEESYEDLDVAKKAPVCKEDPDIEEGDGELWDDGVEEEGDSPGDYGVQMAFPYGREVEEGLCEDLKLRRLG